MRKLVLALGAAALIGGPTALAFFSGGFFDRPRLIAGIAAWALVVVAAALAPTPLPTSTAGRVALAGLFLLTAWTALSLIWAPLGGRAQDDLQRLLLYLASFTASLALLRGAAVRRWFEPAVALAERLIDLVPIRAPAKVWFGHSGSDANEALARLVRRWTGRPRILSFRGAYHGSTDGAAALSGHTAQARYAPGVSGAASAAGNGADSGTGGPAGEK